MGHPAAAEIRDIARRLSRLTADWSDPRRFYQRRDDLVDELEQLASGTPVPSRGDRR